jgi:hypothetical protein
MDIDLKTHAMMCILGVLLFTLVLNFLISVPKNISNMAKSLSAIEEHLSQLKDKQPSDSTSCVSFPASLP